MHGLFLFGDLNLVRTGVYILAAQTLPIMEREYK